MMVNGPQYTIYKEGRMKGREMRKKRKKEQFILHAFNTTYNKEHTT